MAGTEQTENNHINKDTAKKLGEFIARLERLAEEKSALNDDTKVVFAEAKSAGFDVKAIRTVIKLRKIEPHKLEEFSMVVWTYRRALGDLADTPLGDHAQDNYAEEATQH